MLVEAETLVKRGKYKSAAKIYGQVSKAKKFEVGQEITLPAGYEETDFDDRRAKEEAVPSTDEAAKPEAKEEVAKPEAKEEVAKAEPEEASNEAVEETKEVEASATEEKKES